MRTNRHTFAAVVMATCVGVVIVSGGAAVASSPAVGDHPADVVAIVNRYIEVTGGASAYAKLHNRVSTARIEQVGMGYEDKATMYAAMPNKRLTEIESEALGSIRSGTNGTVAWYRNDQTGPIIFEGEELTSELHNAVFDRWAKWQTLYKSSRLDGEAEVDGKKCDKVVMTTDAGPDETYYFEKKTGLLAKFERARMFPGMPPIPITAVLSDYRKAGGILVPFKLAQVMEQCGGKREMIFHTDRIEFNVDLPPNQFDLPPEVALAAKTSAVTQAVKAVLGADGGEKSSGAPCGKKAQAKGSPCGKKAEAKAKGSPCGGKH